MPNEAVVHVVDDDLRRRTQVRYLDPLAVLDHMGIRQHPAVHADDEPRARSRNRGPGAVERLAHEFRRAGGGLVGPDPRVVDARAGSAQADARVGRAVVVVVEMPPAVRVVAGRPGVPGRDRPDKRGSASRRRCLPCWR